MNADEAVLRILIEYKGEFTWDRNANVLVWNNAHTRKVYRHNPPPEASFKRLSIEGYVQVETHSVSVWKFGPRDAYDTGSMIPVNVEANIAKLNSMDNPDWRNRIEIRVALTDRGWQHCANLGLLD